LRIKSVFLVDKQADAVPCRGASMAVFAGVGNAIEVLAGRQIRSQKRRVLVPRRVFEIVIGS